MPGYSQRFDRYGNSCNGHVPATRRGIKDEGVSKFEFRNHAGWVCKYHVVFIPERRKKLMFGKLRKHIDEVLHDLANQKGSEILERHLMQDHIHMCISIPPKYSVSHVVVFIKGKSEIAISRQLGRKRNFTGESFWARGYFVSTVGLDKEMVRAYIREQEKGDERIDQMKLEIDMSCS